MDRQGCAPGSHDSHIKEIVPKLEPFLAKPFTQIFLGAISGA
jgi:hypothetical protein